MERKKIRLVNTIGRPTPRLKIYNGLIGFRERSVIGCLLAQSQKFPLSLLVTIEAYYRLDNYQTRGALLDITQTSPHLRQLLFGHSDSVGSVAFSPDGKILTSASFDGTITLWDVATRQKLGSLKGHTNWVQSLAFSRDGETLASGSADGSIILWDTATHQLIQRLSGNIGSINSIVLILLGRFWLPGVLNRT